MLKVNITQLLTMFATANKIANLWSDYWIRFFLIIYWYTPVFVIAWLVAVEIIEKYSFLEIKMSVRIKSIILNWILTACHLKWSVYMNFHLNIYLIQRWNVCNWIQRKSTWPAINRYQINIRLSLRIYLFYWRIIRTFGNFIYNRMLNACKNQWYQLLLTLWTSSLICQCFIDNYHNWICMFE